MRSWCSPAGPIADTPTSRLPPNRRLSSSNVSGTSLPHSSPAGSKLTSLSRITSSVGAAALPLTTTASYPAARRWLHTLPPEFESPHELVSGDLPTIWMRPENGVLSPVSSPEHSAKHALGESASVPAGKCFHISH